MVYFASEVILEHKQIPVSQVTGIDPVDGIVEAIVSVTNIVDNVNDIILPNAYKSTLRKRNPKVVWSHDTNVPVGKTLKVEELLPGDSRLPADLLAKNAGALLVKMQFNLNTSRGRDAYGDVQFFGNEQEWSIGYSVPEGKSMVDESTGIRKISQLELYEYSPVIFGAAPSTRTLSKDDLIEVEDKEVRDDSQEKAGPKDVKIGDFVSWNSSGGTARGKIEYIMRDGSLGVPESNFSITATPEDPAALIRIYKKGKDGWEETETLVGHKVSTLRKIEDLKTFSEMEETKAVPERYSDLNFSIPSGVKAQAKTGLEWTKEYSRGGTAVGKNTANYLISNETADWKKVFHISAYFARHENEMSLPKNSNPSADGYPGNGIIAWKLWGGDAGKTWSQKLVKAMQSRDEENDVSVVRGPGGRVARVEGKSNQIIEEIVDKHNEAHSGNQSKTVPYHYAYEIFEETLSEVKSENAEQWGYAKVKDFLKKVAHGVIPMPSEPVEQEDVQQEMLEGLSEMQEMGLNSRQYAMYDFYEKMVEEFGKFDQTALANGAHYASENPFVASGMKCSNCVFYEGGQGCEIVSGIIEPEAICKLWVIKEELITEGKSELVEEEKSLELDMELKGPTPSHSTAVNDTDTWVDTTQYKRMRSPADPSYYKKIFGYRYPEKDGTMKTHYTFVHHFVSADGTPGAAAWGAITNSMSVLNGARTGTRLRGAERKAVYNHFKRHYMDHGRDAPELKSDFEIDEIMIKKGIIDAPLTKEEDYTHATEGTSPNE